MKIKSPSRLLTLDQVCEITGLYDIEGWSIRELAAKYKVSYQVMRKVVYTYFPTKEELSSNSAL